MKKSLILISLVIVCCLAAAPDGFGQCRGTDKQIDKPLKIARNRAIARDTIRLCTMHVYRFRAKDGQTLSVRLTAGSKTSLTFLTPSGERLVDGDAREWSGALTEDGEYEIQIGTDATARYTLEILIE